MNAMSNLLQSTCRDINFGSEITGYTVSFGRSLVTPWAVLAARLLEAESQLAMYTQRIEDKKVPRPRFGAAFRALWVVLSKLLAGWERCACLMQPATVKKWHTTAFRVLWRWSAKSAMSRHRAKVLWSTMAWVCLAHALSLPLVSDAAEPKVGLAPLPNSRADGNEGDKVPRGWQSPFSTGGRYEHAVDTKVFHSAPSSARIRGFTDSGRACVGMRTGVFSVVPYYRITFWYRTSRTCRLRGFVRFYDGAKPDPKGNGFFMHNFTMRGAANQWREFKASFEIPAGLRTDHPTARVGVVLYGDPGGTVWFDDVGFGEGSPPPPNPLDQSITKLKDLCLDTIVVRDGQPQAVLAIGANREHRQLAETIQQKVEQCSGARMPIRTDLAPKEALRQTHVIAIGNMATNPFIEALYRRYYTYLDRYYPGKGGHVVRSVHSPYGAGKNVVMVGGSDDAGVRNAVALLLKSIQPGKTITLGWTMDIKLGEGLAPPRPGDKVLAWCNFSGDRPNDKFFGWNPISIDLALYYMTGDAAYIEDFRQLMFPERAPDRRLFDGDRMFGDAKHPLATVYHYRGHMTPLIWDLVEESPVFTNAERLHMTNELLGQQKHLHVPSGSAGSLPGRHGIYEYLNVWTGSRYFARSYPHPVWNERLERVENAFATSLATPASNTPRIQTGTVIWPIEEFALYSGAAHYFEPGGVFAQRMEKWLFLGDEAAGRSWNYQMLHAAADALRDGRFLKARAIPSDALSRFRIGQSYLSDVQPQELTGLTGLRSFKMWKPNHSRLRMSVPLDEAFEFLIFRSSLDASRQHLFLYGYYEGSKSSPRVNSILNYQHHGVLLLRRGQRSAVVVRKDGMRESAPSNAAALKCIEDIGSLAYARTEVPDHDFGRWERSLFILKERCLVVFDRLVVREHGNYEVSVKWHAASSPKPGPDGLRWQAGEQRCAILTADSVSVEREAGAACFTYRGTIDKGDDRLFRSLLTVGVDKDRGPAIAPFGRSAALVQADALAVVGRGALAHQGVIAEGEAFVLGTDNWELVRGTRLAAHGVELRSNAPASLSWDLRNGNLLVRAHEHDVELTLSGADTRSVICRAGSEVRASAKLPNWETTTARLVRVMDRALESAEGSRATAGATTKPRRELDALGQRWRRTLGAAVTAVETYAGTSDRDSGILVGTQKGAHLLRPNGSQRWQLVTDGPVYTVATAQRRGRRIFFVGSDDEYLYALNDDGKLLWKYKARVSEWMAHHHSYWTMGLKAKVRKVLPVDVERDGKLDIFIGTGGSAIERLDEDGKPQWLFTFLYGTPMSLIAADARAEQPGKEILAGAFDCSYNCVVRCVDPATGKELGGQFISRYPAKKVGPRKRPPSSFAQGNVFMKLQTLPNGKQGVLRAVCGRNWNNLALNDAAAGACYWGKDFGPGGGAYLEQFISGVATPDLAPAPNGDGLPDVVAGLRNSWVCAFDGPTGETLWSKRMPSPVGMVAGGEGALANSVLVGCEDGGVYQLDRDGRLTHRTQVVGRPQVGALAPGAHPLWVVGTRAGELVSLSPDLPDAKFGQLPPELPFQLAATGGPGRDSTQLRVLGLGAGRFIAAAPSNAKTWRVELPPGVRAEQQAPQVFRFAATPAAGDMDLRVVSPNPIKATARNGHLGLEADREAPLIVLIQQDATTAPYRRGIVIERDRWGNMRTNGPVVKTLFDGRMAFFMGKKPGEWVEFDLTAPAKGGYDVWACFCKYRDRAVFDVFLDGELLTSGLDLYSPAVQWTQPMLLGKRQLSKGAHVLRLKVVGKAAASSGCFMGLESVALLPQSRGTPTSVTVTPSAAGLRVDWREGPAACTAVFRRGPAAGPIAIGDVAADAMACSVIREDDQITYWELRDGLSLRAQGSAIAEFEVRRDACWERRPSLP